MTQPEHAFYGVLETRNIDSVSVGNHVYRAWYGNSLYFGRDCKNLGFKYAELENSRKKSAKKPPQSVWLDKLYVCEYCFKYTDDGAAMAQHTQHCNYSVCLPGKIKYKDKRFTIRKIRGTRHQTFCQNLCLFAKLFLETKSVFFAVENFDFYVVYGENNDTIVPMGYFSKEVLQCFDENNLGCICVFPPYQQKQLGSLLIHFSYELSRFQGLISGPEHPLSSFGRVGYLSFWSKQLAREFTKGRLTKCEKVSVDQISRATGFRQEDVMAALENMGCLIVDQHQDYAFEFEISRKKIADWIEKKNVNLTSVLDLECLILE